MSVPSNAEINVIIAEEKAIQEASYASTAGLSVRDEVHNIINDKTKDLQSKVDNDMYKLLERYDGEHFLKNPSCNSCYYSSFNINEEQRDLFEKNPRMRILVRSFDKMDILKKTNYLKCAEDYLLSIDNSDN